MTTVIIIFKLRIWRTHNLTYTKCINDDWTTTVIIIFKLRILVVTKIANLVACYCVLWDYWSLNTTAVCFVLAARWTGNHTPGCARSVRLHRAFIQLSFNHGTSSSTTSFDWGRLPKYAAFEYLTLQINLGSVTSSIVDSVRETLKNHSQGILFSIHSTTANTQHNNASAPQQPKQRVRPHPNTRPFFLNVFDENAHPPGH